MSSVRVNYPALLKARFEFAFDYTHWKSHRMDHMPEIIRIVRDAIIDGLIRGENVRRFNHKVKTLKGKDLEDYLQKLWDQV